jgi:hypothetical protein
MTKCELKFQLEIPQIAHNLFDLFAQNRPIIWDNLEKEILITCPLSMVYSLQVRNGELVRKTMSIPTYRPGKKFAFIMNLLYYGPKPINQPSRREINCF